MKKINLLKNLAGLCFVFSIAAILFIQGCKKDKSINATESEEISQYYSKHLVNTNLNPFSTLVPDWDNVYVHEEGQEVIYEIELQNPGKILVSDHELKNIEKDNSLQNIIKLLVFKSKQDQAITGACYMSVLNHDGGDPSVKVKYKHADNFSGEISYYNLNGGFSNGWIYAEGKISKRMSSISREEYMLNTTNIELKGSTGKIGNTNGKKIMLKQAVICNPGVPQFIYGTVCVGGDNGGYVCTTKLTSVVYTEVCEGGGGDNGDGGYTPPGGGGTTYTVDCNGVRNGSAYNSDCGCIGGNTGITECPREIIDSIRNACIKAQLANALTAKTTIKDMLNEAFSGAIQYESLNLVFKDVTNLSDTISGDAKRWSATNTDFEIRLNQNKLPNYSQEYILSTIYHEILHAYMLSKLTAGPDGRYNISTQHEDMANKYIILMIGALKIAFPNISDQEAWGLSWGGLENTNLYTTKLTQGQRDAINETNRRHTNKSATNKQGTYCN